MNEKLARDLAQEQGWAPVTISNMSSDDYNELKSATHSAAMLPQTGIILHLQQPVFHMKL